jgi:hypothetical protein
MSKCRIELREERLQKLFIDCQQQVISQIIGPFGLSTAMFVDKNGGNVTTLHNFSRDDDGYVATENDKILHEKSKESKNGNYVRKEYSLEQTEWEKKRAKIIQNSTEDGYTGNAVSTSDNGETTVALPNGTTTTAPVDHIISLNEISSNPKLHLALGEVKDGKSDVSKIRDIANNDDNLVLTNDKLNASKKAHDLKEWMSATNEKTGKTNAETFGVNSEAAYELYEQAQNSINTPANKALLKKQATELLQTGGIQALKMSGRQALGILLTELVNSLFNEFKQLIRHGVEIGKTLIQEITQRLKNVAVSIAQKIPAALSQGFQGGISGFVSNLLTFLINTFLSTAQKFVTALREGLLGLYRAFKMIFFPPAHLTPDQALQEGIKILMVVITTTIGILLQEAVKAFVSSIPILLPVAEAFSAVLIGIVTGLLSAFLAYQIDCLFDRLRNSRGEKMLDQMMSNANGQQEFALNFLDLTESSLDNVRRYSEAVNLNEEIAAILYDTASISSENLESLRLLTHEAEIQIDETKKTIIMEHEIHDFVEDFLHGEKK